MSDSIYREDVLAFLRKWHEVKDYSYGEKNIIGAAIQEVENLPPCPSWISVRDRLPECYKTGGFIPACEVRSDTVYVTYKTECYGEVYYHTCLGYLSKFQNRDEKVWHTNAFGIVEVVAWMEEPKPYEPKEC